jgi:two-component system OmpR family response regulator
MQTPLERSRHRIVVIDDDPMMVELISTRLLVAGYQVAVARSGYEGLSRLRESRADALILDVNMPGLDGFGVLEHMRKHRLATPTMMLTARNQPADVQRAIALGAKDFLTKPFDDQRLLARVARLLRVSAEAPVGDSASGRVPRASPQVSTGPASSDRQSSS